MRPKYQNMQIFIRILLGSVHNPSPNICKSQNGNIHFPAGAESGLAPLLGSPLHQYPPINPRWQRHFPAIARTSDAKYINIAFTAARSPGTIKPEAQ